ncbi:hypothetical protein EDEG_04040 [Edhazardia aedis USNM 41457]|uniref:Mechanosensitive ion channel MscS domain-containing protein n=1 Tax=Edhazardia aedis (strain USNM 41457) TaxID=1003232 RepID=J9DF71_EDHAE|nr:hypothetical protein EDEG_04040 [Edhazardia aedis USNM 41457]|eukprot:EJW01255.1 hypothetical protein EDEG_04040 [Edhazardia aedis USNM 41457]
MNQRIANTELFDRDETFISIDLDSKFEENESKFSRIRSILFIFLHKLHRFLWLRSFKYIYVSIPIAAICLIFHDKKIKFYIAESEVNTTLNTSEKTESIAQNLENDLKTVPNTLLGLITPEFNRKIAKRTRKILTISDIAGILYCILFSHILMSNLVYFLVQLYISRWRSRSYMCLYFLDIYEHISIFLACICALATSYIINKDFGIEYKIYGFFGVRDLIPMIFILNLLTGATHFLISYLYMEFSRNIYTERRLRVMRICFFFRFFNKLYEQKAKDSNINRDTFYLKAFPPIITKKTIKNDMLAKEVHDLYFDPKKTEISDGAKNMIYRTFKWLKHNATMHIKSKANIQKSTNFSENVYRLSQLIYNRAVKPRKLGKYFPENINYNNLFASIGLPPDLTSLKTNTLQPLVNELMQEVFRVDKSLSQMTSAIRSLRFATYFVIFIFMATYIVSTFLTTLPETIGLISAFGGAAVAFKGSVNSAVDSIIFVFFIHPYDVGDRIFIQSGGEKLNVVVKELNIFSTVFTKFDGTQTFMPNSLLSNTQITNVRRSGWMSDSHQIKIDINTKDKDLVLLKVDIALYLRRNYDKWDDNFMFNFENIEDSRTINCRIFLTSKDNWQNYDKYIKHKGDFLKFLCDTMTHRGIKYTLPVKIVSIKRIPCKNKIINNAL